MKLSTWASFSCLYVCSLERNAGKVYSYFEKGCLKKCTWQSRKALWVVLISLFFKESQDIMAREATDICLWVLKESNKVGSTATKSGTVYWSYPILPFGIVACTLFSTTFLEIAVYKAFLLIRVYLQCRVISRVNESWAAQIARQWKSTFSLSKASTRVLLIMTTINIIKFLLVKGQGRHD